MRIVMPKPNQVLREYRQKLGLSCEEFAKQLRIAEPTLRSLENGTRKITAERAKEIAERTEQALTIRDLRPDLYPDEARVA